MQIVSTIEVTIQEVDRTCSPSSARFLMNPRRYSIFHVSFMFTTPLVVHPFSTISASIEILIPTTDLDTEHHIILTS